MIDYLFLEPSRKINSPGSGKIRSKYTGHQSQHANIRGVTFDASGNELITLQVRRQLLSFSSGNAYFSTSECTVWGLLLFCLCWKEYIKVIAKGRTLASLTNSLSTSANPLLLNYQNYDSLLAWQMPALQMKRSRYCSCLGPLPPLKDG